MLILSMATMGAFKFGPAVNGLSRIAGLPDASFQFPGRPHSMMARPGAQPASQGIFEGQDASNPVMQASDSATADLAAPPTPTPPVAASAQSGMPADVQSYLEHVAKIEAERKALSLHEVTDAAGMVGQMQAAQDTDAESDSSSDGGSSRDEAAKTDQTVAQQWLSLEKEFRSVDAPAECVPLQTAYDRTLLETANMAATIEAALQNADQDKTAALNALTQLQGQSTGRVDTPAKDAEQLLGAIYARYGTQKTFSIGADFTQ